MAIFYTPPTIATVDNMNHYAVEHELFVEKNNNFFGYWISDIMSLGDTNTLCTQWLPLQVVGTRYKIQYFLTIQCYFKALSGVQ